MRRAIQWWIGAMCAIASRPLLIYFFFTFYVLFFFMVGRFVDCFSTWTISAEIVDLN